MQALNNNDYKLYQSIIRTSQSGLKKTLNSYLRKKYKKVYSRKEFLYAVGDIPIALVAHMDTVWQKPPNLICYDREQGIIWSPQGGCGDDRAGVFAILKILQSGLRPTVIFTTDEEMGGVGAEALIKHFPKAPNKVNYIIELDRCNTNDCVFYDCENPDFTKYIESFGFIEAIGSFSDISEICPAWGVAGVNLSIGYVNEHSVSEIVRVPALLRTINRVKEMLKETLIPEFDFIPGPYYYSYYKMNSLYSLGYEDDEKYLKYNCADGSYVQCDKCGKIVESYEIIPVEGINLCPDCCIDGVNWCSACGQAYITDDDTSFLCPTCEEKFMGENCNNKKKKK